MTERPRMRGLERFQDPRFKQMHWISDPKVALRLLDHYRKTRTPYGLEIGFGTQPTRVQHVDGAFDWILMERSEEAFRNAKKSFSSFWKDIDPKDLPDFKMYAMLLEADETVVRGARIIVFRNPDCDNIGRVFPNYNELTAGQRLILVVNETHLEERPVYEDFLWRKRGYKNPFDLAKRSPSLPRLTVEWPREVHPGYVFDTTKPA